MIADARKPKLYTRIVALLISTVVLANSAFAAPKAASFVSISLSGFGRDMQNGWNQTDLSQYFKLPASIATFLTTKSKSARRLDSIVIQQGNLSLQQGDKIDFGATAYQGGEPVAGVDFRWTITKLDSAQPRALNNGRFEARLPGRFIVRASADGFFAEVTVDVAVNRGYSALRLLRKPASERTAEEQLLIASWIANGTLTTRDISSRAVTAIAIEAALAKADQRKRDAAASTKPEKATAIRPETKSVAKELLTPKEEPLPIEKENQDEQTPGSGPNAGNIDAGFGPTAGAMPSRKFNSADPLGWGSTNWATADDPVNWVGRPIGSADAKGAANGNYNLSIPAVNLDGRGIDINLNLEYNSRLWGKAGTQMTYNPDAGYPAPGWNLGFGRMYYMGSTGGCMVVAPDGTRRSYAGTNTVVSPGGYYSHTFTGYTSDGSLIDYSCNYYTSGTYTSLTGSARLPNGTIINYGSPTTAFDQAFPTSIEDAHGNYINISYLSNHGPEINTITDTLGRTITFNYNGAALRSISGPGFNSTTRTFIRFEYFHQTIPTTGLFGSPITTTSVANTTPYQIKAIYYPTTNNGYWLCGANYYSPCGTDAYSDYGILRQIKAQRGMNWNSGPDTIDPGTTNRDEVYNFTPTAISTLTDSPGYSTHTETWDGMDNSAVTTCAGGAATSAAVTCYSTSSGSGSEVITVTQPDGSKNKQTSYVNPGSYTDGMFYQNEILNPSNTVLDKTKMYLGGGAYGSSRVTSVERTDEKSQLTKTDFTYGSNYNQVISQKDYDYGGTTLYREKRYTYENSSNYTNRHIFNLVKTAEDYDNAGSRLTRTVYSYDGATLEAATGVVQFDYTYDPYTSFTVNGTCLLWSPDGQGCSFDGQVVYPDGYTPTMCACQTWDQVSAYNTATDFRGNLTNVTTYTDGYAATGAISHDFTFDIAGNERTATTNCCQQIASSYSTATQFLQPDSITKGSSNVSSPYRMTQSFTYDANTKVPITVVDFNGLTTTIAYDAISRPTLVTLNSGGKKTTTYSDSSLSQTELVQKSDNTTVSNSIAYFNGRGQVNKSTYQAGSSNYNGTQTKYDVMGRKWKTSMPYDTGSSPSNWTEFAYDYLSRVTQQTAPDGSVSAMTYNASSAPSGASSNTGQTVKSSDAWGRERWSRMDAFGRLIEVLEPDPTSTTASLTSPPTANLQTTYAYDWLDRLTTITQGSQTRAFGYDSLGRMTRQKLAEQTATINSAGTYVGSGGSGATWSDSFVYDSRSNITQRTDARGVRTNLSYDISGSPDPLNRLQGISYLTTAPIDTTYTINSAPAVTFEYMTTGDKSRVKKVTTSGIATEENAFDAQGRISEYKLTLDSQTSYPFTTNYSYDTAHRLTQIDYPAQYGMTGSSRKAIVPSYDQASRLSQLNVDGSTQLGDISYNTFSQVTQLKTGAATSNPRIEAYSYDSQNGLLTGQTVKNTSASSTYIDLTYTYARGNSAGSLSGKTGRLTKIVDNLDRNRDRLFEFDSIARLKTAKGGIAAGATAGGSIVANWTQSYSYDRYGNKTGVTASGVDQNNATIPADGLTSVTASSSTNRITTSGWDYDLAGNLIRGQNASGVWQKFEYDAAGRMKKVKDDSNNVLEIYTYGAGRQKLIVEDSLGAPTYYVWGGNSIVCEYTTKSAVPRYAKSYIYAGSRLLMTATRTSATAETKEFHHPDRLGTKVVTNGDTGSYYRQSTLPFGTALGAESTGYSNQVFTSYDRSSGTGLDYATNRMYSQGQSRFTQVDPIGMASASIGNPQSNNLYAYTQNMPTDFVDPSGLNASYIQYFCYDITGGYNTPNGTGVRTTTRCHFISIDGGDSGDYSGAGGTGSGGAATPKKNGDKCTLTINISGINIVARTLSSSSGSSSQSSGKKVPIGQIGYINHLYLTYSDSSNGLVYGLRGGPDENSNLYASSGLYTPNFADYEKNPQGAVVEEYDGNCDDLDRRFNETVKKLNNKKMPYAATGNNSNAFLYTALVRAGINASSFTPRINSFLGISGFAPGWGTEIPLD